MVNHSIPPSMSSFNFIFKNRIGNHLFKNYMLIVLLDPHQLLGLHCHHFEYRARLGHHLLHRHRYWHQQAPHHVELKLKQQLEHVVSYSEYLHGNWEEELRQHVEFEQEQLAIVIVVGLRQQLRQQHALSLGSSSFDQHLPLHCVINEQLH